MFVNILKEHQQVISDLSLIDEEIEAAGQQIIDTFQNSGKVLLMGNGGSAADAQHIAAELIVRYENNRPALFLHSSF